MIKLPWIFVVCMQLSTILATPHLPTPKCGLLDPTCILHKSREALENVATAFKPRVPTEKCTLQDSACLILKSSSFLAKFVNGVPELGVEKLDKMHIDSIEINTDSINHELKNIEIEGLKNAKINDLSFDEVFKIMRLSFDTTLIVTSDYTLNGTLFMTPVEGSGTTTYTIKNVQTDMLFIYDIIKKENGKHSLDFKGYRYGLFMKGGAEYDYKNLFHGDKKRNDAVCAFLNKNWTIITNVFGNSFYGKIYDKVFNAIKTYARSKDLEDLVLFS